MYERNLDASLGLIICATLIDTSLPKTSLAALSSVTVACSLARTINFFPRRATSSS
jgi:hypothetical protein